MVPRGKPSRLAAEAAIGHPSAQPIGVRDRFQFRVEPPVEQNEKAEPRGLDAAAVSAQCSTFARRIVQPVSGVGKSLPQRPKIGVAGIVVAVKAEVGKNLLPAPARKDTTPRSRKQAPAEVTQ